MKKERLVYIENLRIFLIVLVLLQHAARAYGTEVWWFVTDRQAPLLERLTAVNSSFFMSLFFVISFYFMGGSYDTKGFLLFHRDRFLRLCVPLLVYIALVVAPMMYCYFILYRGYGTIPFQRYLTGYFFGMAGEPSSWGGPSWPDINFGHLWFLEHLLVYGALYSLVRLAVKPKETARKDFPSLRKILLAGFLVGLASFFIRLSFPLYRWIGLLGCIQAEPAHVPFYLAMFYAGIYGAKREWLSRIPERTGFACLGIGLACAIVIACLRPDPVYFGGFTAAALLYALVESCACFSLVVGFPCAFRRFANMQTPFLKTLSANTYMVYIVHLPVVVVLQYAALPLGVNPYCKFFGVSLVSVPLSFCLSYFLRKIPYNAKYV